MNFFTMKRVTPNVFTSICYPNIQDGVVNDGFIHCLGSATGTGDTRAITSTDLKSEDELDTDEVDDGPRHVTEPGRNVLVKPLALSNRFPQNTIEDGSLPSSPDTPSPGCGETPDFPTSPNGTFEKETRQLIELFYRMYIGDSRSGRNRDKALSTMRRVVEKLTEKHHFAYNGMILKLRLDQQEDSMSFISCVAKNLFSDGTTNWGRIASLVAFGALVCKHLKESGREHCVPVVSQEISSYLLSDQRDWLLNNKAWEGFVEFFYVEDPESGMRNALVAFAGVAGIGAGLAYLIR